MDKLTYKIFVKFYEQKFLSMFSKILKILEKSKFHSQRNPTQGLFYRDSKLNELHFFFLFKTLQNLTNN